MIEDSIPEDFVISEEKFNSLLLENCPAKRGALKDQKEIAEALGEYQDKPKSPEDSIKDHVNSKKEEYGFFF